MLDFEDTVSALVYSIVAERCPGDDHPDLHLRNDVVRFVIGQHGRTPDYLRLPLRLITLVFDAWPVLRRGRPFHSLSPELRAGQIDRWRTSRVAAMRDFVRYFEGLAIFGWYAFRFETAEK